MIPRPGGCIPLPSVRGSPVEPEIWPCLAALLGFFALLIMLGALTMPREIS